MYLPIRDIAREVFCIFTGELLGHLQAFAMVHPATATHAFFILLVVSSLIAADHAAIAAMN
jgi:hypothetical protein